MSKRKAKVNDIIFELDDIEISSDDEIKDPKIRRTDAEKCAKSCDIKDSCEAENTEVITIDSCEEILINSPSSIKTQNGGKTTCNTASMKNKLEEKMQLNIIKNNKYEDETCDSRHKRCSDTIIFDEDIVIDSPASNSDLGVVGCENRIPIVTVRFKDNKLAHNYKKTIKEFLINLLKSHNKENLNESDTDNELDIWPEDLVEEEYNRDDANVDDNLFFVDTDPCDDVHSEIPKYSQASQVISNLPKKEDSPPQKVRWKFTCFNCDGEHNLRECPLPRDHQRIAGKRKNMATRVGRYHVEDEQKYGHLVPGRISGPLRNALGLKRYELPLHIYRMRLLGYPPGWLEDARISHSGITLFDSTGNAILDPGEEEGEYNEPGSKDKFDIKKILDFPGYNVPASSRYIEEAHLFGLPPMSEQDSKMLMLQNLAPNAVKAYKRKKLMFFPSNNFSAQGQVEMDLDSGEEIPEFPSVPPLPDEAPPPQPPPPPPPPEDKPPEAIDKTESPKENLKTDTGTENISSIEVDSSDDLEVIDVMQVPDIPVPGDEFITIDEYYDNASLSSDRNSPSLDDLEEKKRLLLNALKGGVESDTSFSIIENGPDITEVDNTIDVEEVEEFLDIAEKEQKEKDSNITDKIESELKNNVIVIEETVENTEDIEKETIKISSERTIDKKLEETSDNTQTDTDNKEDNKNKYDVINTDKKSDIIDTPDPKSNQGKVKTTLYGTPVINGSSPYMKLPGEDKFSKDICDVLNFENLPNSTGKYKKICSLLKKVKSEVDRIQES